jgi:methylated-DNA-[protein]-cysteine S-methyltransferase
MNYQAKLSAPFGILGIRCEDDALTGIDFLPLTDSPEPASCLFAEAVCGQLTRYFDNPDAQFSLALKYPSTAHQQRVWQAISAIPCGQTRSYGELARQLHSGAQAIGQACGANPIPVIIPCHRVVGRTGLGGFMHNTGNTMLDIKRWLLAHEANQC